MTDDYQYGRGGRRWAVIAAGTLLVVTGLFFVLQRTTQPQASAGTDGETRELVIYCALGIRNAVDAVAQAYTEKYGIQVRLETNSSGALEKSLVVDKEFGKSRADLYIPADSFFAEKAASKDLIRESIPLAQFRLVLATKPEATVEVASLDQLLASDVRYVLCNKDAGVGKKTADTLGDRYEALAEGVKSVFPTVTEAASTIQTSRSVDAGFIWNTTARQFGLDIVELPEIAGAVSTITVNVVTSSRQPTAALHFARYLSAPKTGNPSFAKFHFNPIAGDAWAERPEITLFCGGVNRTAIEQTIKDFQLREGVDILTSFAGCGELVTTIKGIDGERVAHFPDAFLTCEASYLDKVAGEFGLPLDVSSTDVVMLVRKGNPKNIHSLSDIVQNDINIGTADRGLSALGELSWDLFADVGIKDQLEAQRLVVVTTRSAHELIMQMVSHPKLDVAFVYRANCVNVGDQFEQISIDHPAAKATQNVAVARRSEYPLLTGRLLDAIRSADSKQRFLSNGFEWLVQPTD